MCVQKWPFQICGMSGGKVPEGHIVTLNSYSPGHLNSAHLVGGLQLWLNVLWFLDTIVHSPAEPNHDLLAKGHDWVLHAFNNLL